MGYNYFKIVLANAVPNTETSREMISTIRKAHQQAHSFTRELRKNIHDTRPLLEASIPGLKGDFLSEIQDS